MWRRLLDATYDFRMNVSERTGWGIQLMENNENNRPPANFFSLHANLSNGQPFAFENLRGKWVLIVNTASLCGYTPQYRELQEMYQRGLNFEILAFPSNDFKGQEPKSNEDIQTFCQTGFGISFPLFAKSHVKGDQKNGVYRWLSTKSKNGWNEQEPRWNFYKYLIDPEGVLRVIAGPAVKPKKMLAYMH